MKEFNSRRFAVISDIHSNSDALKAVFQDISAQNVESIVNLGDHFSGPMAARETAELLLARQMPSIRGNHDRWLVEHQPKQMGSIDRIAFDQLEERHLDWLRQLPATLVLSDKIFACHGTPSSDTEYWLEQVSPNGDVLLRPRAEIAQESRGINASLFLCGHSHLPRRIDLPEGRVILNPGSVGCPGYTAETPVHHVVQAGTGAACYALVEQTKDGWGCAFRYVPYDPSRMIRLAKDADHLDWESRLTTGWVV